MDTLRFGILVPGRSVYVEIESTVSGGVPGGDGLEFPRFGGHVLCDGVRGVVAPLGPRRDPWEYDQQMYKKRNEIERLFRRLKGCRRIPLIANTTSSPA